MPASLLIVEDDAAYGRSLRRALEKEGHDVSLVGSTKEALERFESLEPEVVLIDYQLPDGNGLDLLDALKPLAPMTVFLINTAYPDLDIAVDAMRRGAADFLAKDRAMRECIMRVERAVDVARLRRRVVEKADTDVANAMLGDSPPMQRLRARLDALVASDDTTVFIVGETGTGKGVVARQIHRRSGRAYEPLVAVDCTTIPATLVESELFGHERGAFSGATGSKMGRVEVAARGTLFLDEIGELELPIQTKLLRLLEEREFTRVGGTQPRHLKARVITATNRNLDQAVAEGRFRADLRYRLEVFVVEMPPLRKRGTDIHMLAEHFAAERSRALGRPPPRLSDPVRNALRAYRFPGNVRELRNMVEQAVLLSPGEELTLEAFPVLVRDFATPSLVPPSSLAPRPSRSATMAAPRHAVAPAPLEIPPETTLGDIRDRFGQDERQRIVEALEASGGNVSAAARDLGLSRYQLLRRLRKYGLR
ncbi:MAG: sigma-54-dependent transcriptional regulator [Sandaracinaceae bacterium]